MIARSGKPPARHAKVSIKDIAKVAGVSHSTVSRALRHSLHVRPDTTARIRALADEMGYSPDAAARSLAVGRTQTVGIVATTITDPFIAEVVRGIESTAYAGGYSVILASSDAEPERELASVEMLRSKRVDAVIVTSSRIGSCYRDHLEKIGVPVVLLNSHREGQGQYTYSVRVDDRQGGQLAAEHLIRLGHQRIAYISGGESNSTSNQRHDGYRAALERAGITFDPGLVVPGTGRLTAGEQALPVLLALPSPPSAVFCYNDLTAIGLMRAAREAGLRVPEDLSIAGFDDIPMALYVFPPLTTIAQPKFELGQRAMLMAFALLAPGTTTEQVKDVLLEVKLVIRCSTTSRGGRRSKDMATC